MIQQMARENGESYKTDPSVLRETITATVKALGEGRIRPEEIPIEPHTKPEHIRYAPGYSSWSPAIKTTPYPYTLNALAKFLGATDKNDRAKEEFKTTFAALELISEGHMKESDLKGLDTSKIGEAVRVARATKEAAIKRAERLAVSELVVCCASETDISSKSANRAIAEGRVIPSPHLMVTAST